MSRLIDADALLKKFCVNSEGRRIPEVDCDNHEITVSIKDIKRIIREQPTAYDVENVVEEIKSQFGCKDCEYADVSPTPYVCLVECAELEVINDICDIVKRGGVE